MNDPLEQRLAQIAEENGLPEHEAGVDWYFMRLGVKAAQEWYPIESAQTDELHMRGLWVYGPGQHGTREPLYFAVHIGRIDDEGCFVDEDWNEYGWSPEDYTHWKPLPPEPKL